MESTLDATAAWRNHISSAVKSFLKTAVVIDNMPYVVNTTTAASSSHEVTEPWFDEEAEVMDEPIANESLPSAHHLDVRKISDEFAGVGIACAFVLPDDQDSNDQAKITRILNAAKVSDLVVIDWYLKDKDSSLTLQVLEEIAKSDQSESGRLRLVCVYTGQAPETGIFIDVKEHFKKGGIELVDTPEISYCAQADNTLVVLINKREITPEQLPEKLISLFSCLADGLIPTFALAAVGAIRKNTHHMLTRFESSLDSAYISNRLITNPPGDVAELMRELLVAECDNALGLDRIADDYLDKKAITLWLDANSEKIKYTNYTANKTKVQLTRDLINALLINGIEDRSFFDGANNEIPLPEFYRKRISESLAGSPELSKASENKFSRLVSFRREAYGSSTKSMNPDWLPSLTTGTVLKMNDGEVTKYLMCFTPACDALRLLQDRPFVFLEGYISDTPYNSVIIEDNDVSIGVFFDKKYPSVKTFGFSPDAETERVRAQRVEKDGAVRYEFSSSGPAPIQFEWLGEIRYSRAASEVAALANVWMRIGIVDSEYLRLATKGHAKFS
ncbi:MULTISPECIES: response regulator receiver domain [Pseudomonas]|uniref:Response receiver domain-containing protein n=1 Tax=Pseudomonas fulva TaxID=47880 RepID=A0A0D0KH93_9PSED|nr:MULTISPECIES: response regulator receiver domain [Pseudomonas]KIP98654.1 hypothetical protein RU08_15560 [Pseudomonas fulva]